MAGWKFYGRRQQLADLERMLDRKRWFFAKVTGRRRIGKTALIQQAMVELGSKQPVFYVQIPDSEPVGVLSAMNDALETFQVPLARYPRPYDLLQLAKLLEAMPKYEGWDKTLVGISPALDTEQRALLTRHDILPQDLNDLTRDLS
jgi:hypothetical protein